MEHTHTSEEYEACEECKAKAQSGKSAGERYEEQSHCCTVCAAKRRCHVCDAETALACSDCAINLRVTVYVCRNSKCRDRHEEVCSAASEQNHKSERVLLLRELAEEADRKVEQFANIERQLDASHWDIFATWLRHRAEELSR